MQGRHAQAALETLERRRMLSAGDIDPSFGTNGLTTIDFGGDGEVVAQLLPAPNGKFLALGRVDSGANLAVARFNADGTIDSSFANGGKTVTTVIAAPMTESGSIAVDPASGRFAVIYTTSSGGDPAGVALFTANGALDTAFSSDGLIQHDNTFVGFEKVGFQSGKLIIAGRGYDVNGVNPGQPFDPSDYVDPVLIRRYNFNGTQDTAFGTGTGAGHGTTALTHADTIEDMEVMSDGRIVIATHFQDDDQPTTIGQEIYRLTTNGALDNAFAGDGSVTFGEMDDASMSQTLDMDVLADNSVIALSTEGTLNLALHKFSSGGIPVSGFTTAFDRLGRFPTRLGVASGTGEIFLSDNSAVMRYSSDGRADYTYGVDGASVAGHGSAALVNANGTVIVGGTSAASSGNQGDWQVTRLQGGAGAQRKPSLNRKGTLLFQTTNDNDTVSVSYRTRDGRLIVRLGNFAQSFIPSKVKRICLLTMDGNDTVTIGANVRGVYVDGGAGNDTVNGGQGGDVLLGGSGADKLYGNDGDDILVAGEGNDYCVGGAGKDDLWGEDGSDTLSGAGGNDRIFGGDGADQCLGGSGADSSPNDSRDKRDSIETLLT